MFVGTGGSPYQADVSEDATVRNLFLAYVDGSRKGICNQAENQLDWFVELPESHRITASVFVSAGRVSFGTTTSNIFDICAKSNLINTEEGFLYDLNLDGTEIVTGRVGDIHIEPLVVDEHLYLMMPSGLKSLGSGVYNNRMQSFSEPEVSVSFPGR